MPVHLIGEGLGSMHNTSHIGNSSCLRAGAAPAKSFQHNIYGQRHVLLRAPSLIAQLQIAPPTNYPSVSSQQRPVFTSAAADNSGSPSKSAQKSVSSIKVGQSVETSVRFGVGVCECSVDIPGL